MDSIPRTSEFRLAKGADSILITYGLNAQGKADTLYFEPDREYLNTIAAKTKGEVVDGESLPIVLEGPSASG